MSSATGTITRIFTEHLVPVLTERGFTASGTTFRRPAGGATQVVHLQRGSRNSVMAATFHVNGGVYLPALDAAIGAPTLNEPDEPSCHVRLRPDRVVTTGKDVYTVTQSTEKETFGVAVADDLAALLGALDEFVTPESAVAYLSTKLLTQYERVFAWHLQHGDLVAARRFAKGLWARFGAEKRWDIFATKLDAVSLHVTGGVTWRDWLEE